MWEVSSYPGFVAATSEVSGGVTIPLGDDVKALNIPPQPPAEQVNWLNLFYAVEWVVFAGFSIFIWWRLVKDDYHRDLEDALDGHAEAHEPEQQPGTTRQPEHTDQKVQP